MQISKVAVIGGGSWATALVKILSENLSTITWYMRNTVAIDYIKKHKHNLNYITSIEFDMQKIHLTDDINYAVSQVDCLILAVPSAFLCQELNKIKVSLTDKIIFSAIKGVVPETGLIVGEHLIKSYGLSLNQIGVITGPCHAEEIALERLSYLTIACIDKQKAKQLALLLESSYLHTTLTSDTLGVEYAGMLKNIYAIAAGIAHGLGYGDNFQSVLMSNAIREMQRYISAISPLPRNINASAYLGDLLVTGYSTFSRNRMLGNMIGKGYTLKSAFMEMNMVAEGYYAVNGALQSYKGIESLSEIPILHSVYQILYQDQNARIVFRELTKLLD